jgi:hypothetical protein
MIKTKVMYECPGTGKLYDTQEQALKAQRTFRAAVKKKEKQDREKQELEQCVNFVRLNARSPGEAWDMAIQRSLDIWGVSITYPCDVNFTKSNCFNGFESRFNCSAQVIDESKYARYHKVFMKNRTCFVNDLDDFINHTNKGFTFWGGGSIKENNKYDKSSTLRLDMVNFPAIESNWKVILEQRKLIERYKNRKRALANSFHALIHELEEVQTLNKDIVRLDFILKGLVGKRDNIVDHNMAEFRVLLDKSIPLVGIDHELNQLFESVKINVLY